jgi:hypothetical protein
MPICKVTYLHILRKKIHLLNNHSLEPQIAMAPHARGAVRPSLSGKLGAETKGAGKAGCSPHPRPRVGIKEPHELIHHRLRRIIRPSLRNGFNGFLRDLPGEPGFFATVACRTLPASLTPASGCQDHTTSPSAHNVIRLSNVARVHRIPPHVS